MKCPKCEFNQKAKAGLTCQNCGYKHVFNPKIDRLSDVGVSGLVNKLATQAPYYTATQVFSAYYQSNTPTNRVVLGVFVAIGLGITFWLAWGNWAIILIALFFAGALLYGQLRPLKLLTYHEFQRKLGSWLERGNTAEGLLQVPSLVDAPAPADEPDIYDYGVEGIVIVQEDIYVDLLVRNEFHVENKVLVLSQTGYPHYLVEKTNQLLAERSDLPVFFLHDATHEGIAMPERVRNAGVFQLTHAHPQLDLGIFSESFAKLPPLKRFEKVVDFQAFAPLTLLTYGQLTKGLQSAITEQKPLDDVLLSAAYMNAISDFG